MLKRAVSSSCVKPTTYCPSTRRAASFGCAPATAASDGVLGKSGGTLASSLWAMRYCMCLALDRHKANSS